MSISQRTPAPWSRSIASPDSRCPRASRQRPLMCAAMPIAAFAKPITSGWPTRIAIADSRAATASTAARLRLPDDAA
ncbi:MAG: hypothetical protein KIT31_38805 [Deltaproteobacteria bacterium]|nr:hypothetical protein [Deltaproteobacteria bacterium]